MVRRYDDPIDVKTEPGTPDEPGQPTAFVWRGRLYVVRGVLAQWYERRAWWRDTASLALLGLRADVAAGAAGSGPAGAPEVVGAAAAQGTVAAPAADGVLPDAGEREVWRVEAAAGRSSPVGIYELVRDPLPNPPDVSPGRLPDQRPGMRPSPPSGPPSGPPPGPPPGPPSGPRPEISAGGWRLASVED